MGEKWSFKEEIKRGSKEPRERKGQQKAKEKKRADSCTKTKRVCYTLSRQKTCGLIDINEKDGFIRSLMFYCLTCQYPEGNFLCKKK